METIVRGRLKPGRRVPGIYLVTGMLLVFVSSTSWASSYVIETIHGRTIIVSVYWSEGQEIKFYKSGGIVGIPRDLVKEIREISDPLQLRILEEASQPFRIERPSLTEPPAQPSSPTVPLRPGIDTKYVAEVMEFEARAQHLGSLSKAELMTLAQDGVALRERILASGQPYYEDAHLIKLHALLDKIAEVARRQP